jgi:hypothetical protein
MQDKNAPVGKWPEPSRFIESPGRFEQDVDQFLYEKNRPSLWSAVADTTLSSDIGRWLGKTVEGFNSEPDWREKYSSELDNMLASTPFEYHDDLLSSSSFNEAIFEKTTIDEKLRNMQRVADSGALGVGSVLAINLFEGAALGALTFPATAPALVGTGYRGFRTASQTFRALRVAKASQRAVAAAEVAANASRIGLFARGSLVGMGEALAYTTIDSMVDPTVEAHDFRSAAIFGAALGGSFNALAGKSILASELASAGRRLEQDLLNRGYQLPPRFGADDLVARLADATNIDRSEAAALIALGDALGIDLSRSNLAVGGRKMKGVVGSTKINIDGMEMGTVEFLEDGRAILRSFYNDTPNPETALRGVAAIIRRRLFNADLPETSRGGLTDNEVRIVDEWLGRGPRIFREAERGPGGVVGGMFVKETTPGGPRRLVRTTKWTSGDERKFANGFFRWMMTGEKDDIPENVIPVFEKVRLFLAKVYDGMSDPRLLSGRKPNQRIANMFEKVLVNEIKVKQAAEQEFMNSLLRASSGSGTGFGAEDALSIPDVEPTGTSKNWAEVPNISGIYGVGSTLLNQSVRAMGSIAGDIRWLAYNMHFTRVAPRDKFGNLIAQPTTVNEFVHRIKAVSEARFLRSFNKNFNEYVSGGKSYKEIGSVARAKNMFRHDKKAEFNLKVYEEIHSPGAHADRNVKAAADAARAEFKMMAGLAKKAKVAGFENLASDPNYFPRLYRWDAIDAFVLKHGQDELKKVLLNAIDKAELSGEEAEALSTLLAERLVKLARGERKASVFNLDEEVLEVLGNMKKPKDPKGPILTPRVRARFKADPLVTLKDGSKASLSTFVETDIPTALGSYVRSVSGAIGETKLIARFKAEVAARDGEEIANKIEKFEDIIEYVRERNRTNMTADDLDAQIGSLRELRANMRSEPDPSNFGGDNTMSTLFSENARRLMKISYLQNGSYFALAQINEISRAIARAGFRSVWSQLPVVSDLLKSAKRGEPVNEVTYLLEQTFGLASDRIRRTTGRIDDALNRYPPEIRVGWYRSMAKKLSKLDANLDAAVFAFADLTGLAPITSATQHLTAMSLIQRMYRIGTKGDKDFADTLITQWGISRKQYDTVIASIKKFADVDKNGRVIALNEENWDTDAFRAFLTFVERGTIATIQDPPARGDFHKFFFTPVGKLMIQFRTFNLKGIDSFLKTSLQRGDATVLKEYLLTGTVAMLTQTARKQLDYAAITDQKKRKKFAEENFSMGAAAAMFASGPTENFMLIAATDALSNLAFGRSTFGDRIRYTGLSSNPLDLTATPAWAVLDRAFKAARGPVRAMLNSDYDYSQKDLHNLRMTIPMGRFYGIGQGLSLLEERLGKNLPEESKQR